MPLERVSKGFKDISMSFQRNALNNDLIGIKNETAISRSIRNIVLSLPGERFFNEEFGSDISSSLFENMNDVTADVIKSQIFNSIRRFEPRVDSVEVDVSPDYDNNEFNVTVRYEIVGISALPQELTFALEQTR